MPEPSKHSEQSNFGLGCLPLLVLIILIIFVVLVVFLFLANSYAEVSVFDISGYDEIQRYLPELFKIII